MGIAIILNGVDFSNANLGQVTLTDPVSVENISLEENISSYIGPKFRLAVDFTPIDTTERGITWNITSGSQYATIDTSTGEVTVLTGANANTITVKATSTSDPSINATKNIVVTYYEKEVTLLSWIKTGGANYVLTDVSVNRDYEYSAKFSPQGAFSNSAAIFGSKESIRKNDCHISINAAGSTCYIVDSLTNNGALIAGMAQDHVYLAKIKQDSPYYEMYDETSQASKTANNNTLNVSDFATNSHKIMLFNINNSGAPLGSDYGFAKIYEFKAKHSGSVIADYVPALVDDEPVFFDKIGKAVYAISGNSTVTYK